MVYIGPKDAISWRKQGQDRNGPTGIASRCGGLSNFRRSQKRKVKARRGAKCPIREKEKKRRREQIDADEWLDGSRNRRLIILDQGQ